VGRERGCRRFSEIGVGGALWEVRSEGGERLVRTEGDGGGGVGGLRGGLGIGGEGGVRVGVGGVDEGLGRVWWECRFSRRYGSVLGK